MHPTITLNRIINMSPVAQTSLILPSTEGVFLLDRNLAGLIARLEKELGARTKVTVRNGNNVKTMKLKDYSVSRNKDVLEVYANDLLHSIYSPKGGEYVIRITSRKPEDPDECLTYGVAWEDFIGLLMDTIPYALYTLLRKENVGVVRVYFTNDDPITITLDPADPDICVEVDLRRDDVSSIVFIKDDGKSIIVSKPEDSIWFTVSQTQS